MLSVKRIGAPELSVFGDFHFIALVASSSKENDIPRPIMTIAAMRIRSAFVKKLLISFIYLSPVCLQLSCGQKAHPMERNQNGFIII